MKTSEEGALFEFSVPGNLLLLGEYAVLEEGGLGITLAVEPRVVGSTGRASELTIVGRTADGEIRWPGGDAGLFSALVEACELLRGGRGPAPEEPVEIRVDSSRLPKGFGSSAAVAVSVCAALLGTGETPGGTPGDRAPAHRGIGSWRPADVFSCALQGHRAFQGGRGSGYDIATSLNGGMGLFVGGTAPEWRPLSLPWMPPLRLLKGAGPVRTSGAIGRYDSWKKKDPSGASRFLSRSNQAVLAFSRASSWKEAREAFDACRALGLELGEHIGVSARFETDPEYAGDAGMVKALGAGAELAVAIDGRRGEPLRLDVPGLVVEHV